ncbi:apolipoprotein N-acyltransferase [Rhodobacteraceae bacterium 63075]|nr:apolipoprotein N-acyltransferase [Rhodobacteraceae bacterium 63075]
MTPPDAAPRWLVSAPLKGRMALAALAGATASLGLAPFELWPIALFGLAFLFVIAPSASGRKQAFWTGWAAATGYFAVALAWIVEPFFVDPWRHGWMAPFALVLLAGGLALFWGAAFAAAHRKGPLALAAALALAELARAYLLTGFPWALIGYLWLPSPMALYGAWIGPHGLTLLTLLIAAGLSLRVTGNRLAAYGVLFATVLLLSVAPRLIAPAPEPGEDAPLIRLIQPNAAQREKWDPDLIPLFYERQLGYTRAGDEASRRPDLVVWPETAIPWLLSRAGPALDQISEAAGPAPVVLGVQRFEGRALHNSLLLIGPDGSQEALYDKHHLVPFGEYIPYGDALGRFGIAGLAAQAGNGYAPGPGPRTIEIGGIGTALPLICYEAVFPQDVRGAPERPDLLLQITNDAWFGRFSGPYQHLDQARMRAIEQGLPMIRAANTGISALIGPRGEVRASLALGEAGFLDAPLPAPLPPTPYARSGDLPALLAALLVFAGAGLQARAARRRNSG